MKDNVLSKMLTMYKNHHMSGGYKVIACAIIGKTCIFGVNGIKSHPLQKLYGKNSSAIYLHAEIDILRKMKQFNTIPSCIYVLRGTNVQFLPSLPCFHCQIALKHFGITKFIDCNTLL